MDIIQIKVDLPPSYPIFDKFIFGKVLIMLTSLPPLEFLTKIMKFLGFETYILYYPYYFLMVRGTDRKTERSMSYYLHNIYNYTLTGTYTKGSRKNVILLLFLQTLLSIQEAFIK